MSPYIDDPDFQLHIGDALQVLQAMPAESVHCVVTSPPYWGLRDYGTEGQLGLEPTPDQYVTNMVNVFREVRRVLRADGTLWLNIGDSYASQPAGNKTPSGFSQTRRAASEGALAQWRPGNPDKNGGNSNRDGVRTPPGLKPKDLVGIPWRLAFALQADGWYLRSDIIWSKPNPMPESVTDRPTKAHEYLFLLTKSPRYFYDADAIREPAEWARWGDQTNGKHEGSESAAGWIGSNTKADLQKRGKTWDERKAMGFKGDTKHPTTDAIEAGLAIPSFASNPTGRNKRSVWEIATEAYPDAHFATFPQALVEPCVKVGCPEDGVVLDPFLGSGTTAQVARRLGRRSIGIELNPEYAQLAARRLQQQSLFA